MEVPGFDSLARRYDYPFFSLQTPLYMATATAKPKTTQASKLLDQYAELYQQKLEVMDAAKMSIAPLDEKLAVLKGKLEDWSNNNVDAFEGKKTLVLDGGTFGHKLGTKAVSFPLEGPADVKEKYLAIVKAELPGAIVESVNAKLVVDSWSLFPNLVKKLLKLGVSVKQENSFFITPKK